MGYDASVMRAATEEFNRRKMLRSERKEKLRREIYNKVPELVQIEKQMRLAIVEVSKAALQTGVDPGPAIREARAKNQSLQKRRTALLLENGYHSDALDDVPACVECGDSGWVRTKMCRCLKELCTVQQNKQLSNTLNLSNQTFDHFDLDYYDTQFDPTYGTSPRANMETIYEVCVNYARRFGKHHQNLMLYGGTGLGKTFLSACIAKEVSENGFSVVYDTAVNVFNSFEREKFARDADEAKQAREETRKYLNCDLLILDDLGSEMTTPLVQTTLYTIVNTRLNGKQTVINTNLDPEVMHKRYSDQVCSRVEGEYEMLPFFGEDIRLIRRKQM